MENEKTPGKKPAVRIPPKRGQVKVKMFKQLVKKVMSVITPGKQGGSSGSSASTPPTRSTCPAEEHSHG
ncbi:hypothetical protein DITRI_Ditri12bG0084200 [Diplodiscus trichospermus]